MLFRWGGEGTSKWKVRFSVVSCICIILIVVITLCMTDWLTNKLIDWLIDFFIRTLISDDQRNCCGCLSHRLLYNARRILWGLYNFFQGTGQIQNCLLAARVWFSHNSRRFVVALIRVKDASIQSFPPRNHHVGMRPIISGLCLLT